MEKLHKNSQCAKSAQTDNHHFVKGPWITCANNHRLVKGPWITCAKVGVLRLQTDVGLKCWCNLWILMYKRRSQIFLPIPSKL